VGEGKLIFDQLAAGDRAPERRHVLTRTDIVRYAGVSGDMNPMHHDEIQAVAAGQPSVFGHGMLSMGLLGAAVTDFVGVGNLTHYSVRFVRQTWPGEELVTRVVVAGTRVEGRRRYVDLDVALANSAGEDKVVGRATAEVPAAG
jgi:acyl dehydratase